MTEAILSEEDRVVIIRFGECALHPKLAVPLVDKRVRGREKGSCMLWRARTSHEEIILNPVEHRTNFVPPMRLGQV